MKAIPNYLEKRRLLYSKGTSPEELKELGDLFLRHDHLNDAIDFYEKARYREGLEEIGRLSRDIGDFFLFRRVVDLLNLEVTAKEWETLGDRAMEFGRFQDARKAYRMSQNSRKLQMVEEAICPKERTSDKDEEKV